MSGHSHWATIKRAKGAADAKKGKIFSKLGKEITIVVKAKGGNPDNNPTLRTLIAKAKAAQMPNDNIERAIKKGTGELESAEMVDCQYEGIKNGTAIVVHVLTDNKNRAAAEVGSVFKKNGIELAKPGSASRLFDKLGQVMIPAADGLTEDKVMEVALEAGAEDVLVEDGGFTVKTQPNDFVAVSDAIKAAGIAIDEENSNVGLVPNMTNPVSDVAVAKAINKFVEMLEDAENGLQKGDDVMPLVEDSFAKCPNVSLEQGILEKTDGVDVMLARFGWSDIGTWDALYDVLMERCGYIRALQEKDTPENQSRIENVGELKSNILSFIKETGDSSLNGFLDEVALYTDLDTMDADADCVVMMTIHSAKGLEFPVVFLVGAEEGLFPGTRSIGEPEEMEEERRLCYVAITRAEKKLYITCAQQRMIFGRTSSNRVSRFVEEIPPEHIEKGYVPRGYGYAAPPRGFRASVGRPQQPKPPIRPVITPATAKAAPPAFHKGDMVQHKSFGLGMITAMTPMGGDFLVEIAFDGVGTKRLMLNAAAKLMQKA